MQENVNMKKIIDGTPMKKEHLISSKEYYDHLELIKNSPAKPKVIQALSEEEIQRAHELLHKGDK